MVKATGRPPKNPNKVKYYDTKLHKFLMPKFLSSDNPDVRAYVKGGRINTTAIADACGVVRFTVYRWFDADTLPSTAANKLIKISKGCITIDDVAAFVLTD